MYKCEFPGCDYKTSNRSNICCHHIIPKNIGGTNSKYNKLWLCPTHHTFIYIPEHKKGIHAKKHRSSIIVIRKAMSSNGLVLIYKHPNKDEEIISLIGNKYVV